MESQMLEEYRALRAELIGLMSRRATIQNIGTALFAGLQLAALHGGYPEISLVGTLLILSFWRDDQRWIEAVAKIGSYIREILEPCLPGLKWQTHLMKVDEVHRDKPSPAQRVGLLLSRYPMTALLGLLIGVGTILIHRHPIRTPICLFLLLVCVALFVYLHFFIDSSAIHRKWGDRFRSLRSEEEALRENM
jgi:hypothetical protein